MTSSISSDDACAYLVDTFAGLDLGKIGVVDLLEIGFGKLAVARQRLVDNLVERRVVSGRVDIPDFIIARDGGLLEALDLPSATSAKAIVRSWSSSNLITYCPEAA